MRTISFYPVTFLDYTRRMGRPKAGENEKLVKLQVRMDARLDAQLDKVLKLEPDITKSQHARIAIREYCQKLIAKHKAMKG